MGYWIYLLIVDALLGKSDEDDTLDFKDVNQIRARVGSGRAEVILTVDTLWI